MIEGRAVARARACFLREDGRYGCAEAAFLALAEAFGLEDAAGSAPAMALNGGVAYSGGTCGAITGAALAVGMLAGLRLPDHAPAKKAAREKMMAAMDGFVAEFGSASCRDLTGVDLRAPGGHEAFIEAGTWRTRCLAQIEFVVGALAPLAEPAAWKAPHSPDHDDR